MALFGCLSQRRDNTLRRWQIKKNRLGRQIIIPDIMVDSAKIPANLTIARIQSNDRSSIEVATVTLRTDMVRTGITHG